MAKAADGQWYGKIKSPWWDDKPVAIVAGGPSLKGFDFERLRDAHVLAIKGSIFDIPWADAGFGLDMLRYRDWQEKLANVPSRVYWAVPEDQLERTGQPPSKNVTFIKRLDGQGFSTDPGEVYTGGTSGYGGLQVAILKRAKRIVLFGYDYDGNYNPNAEFRHNDQHYERRRDQSAMNWMEWAGYFDGMVPRIKALGVEVVNACPHSQIKCFPKMTVDDAVAYLHRV